MGGRASRVLPYKNPRDRGEKVGRGSSQKNAAGAGSADGGAAVHRLGYGGDAAGAAGHLGVGLVPGAGGFGPSVGPLQHLPHRLRLVQHRISPAEPVEPGAHAHVGAYGLLPPHTLLLHLLLHRLRAQPAYPPPAEPVTHPADVLRRALLRHAAALALGLHHLGDCIVDRHLAEVER